MVNRFAKSKLGAAAAVLLAVGLSGCSSDNDNSAIFPEPVEPAPAPAPPPPPEPVVTTFEVTVTNLTNAQPLSPIAVVIHGEGNLWTLGESASEALEIMAEGGMNGDLLALPIVIEGVSSDGPLPPGMSTTMTISVEDNDNPILSVATMLVNTNDAFTGVNAQNLSALPVGGTYRRMTRVYDAGTEANTEAAGTMPGPADMGTGYDPIRDDVDYVTAHAGIVGNDDGLSTSVLNKAYDFDNPAMRVTVTRTQ